MGVAAKAGRNKLTIVTSAAVHDFGAWLEQLVAESTGKLGKAIIPVDLEGSEQPILPCMVMIACLCLSN
jgi:transaldolase/glucose-6-phosphate isomerase